MEKIVDYIREAIESFLDRNSAPESIGWQDSVQNEVGFLKDMEALETFLTPINMLGAAKLVKPDFISTDGLTKAIATTFSRTIDFIETKGFPPSPYLDKELLKVGIDYSTTKINFSDSVSFFITLFADIWEFSGNSRSQAIRELRIILEEKIKYLKEAIDWIIDNAREYPVTKGNSKKVYWEWGEIKGPVPLPSLYSTYSVSVALDSLLETSELKREIADRYGEELVNTLVELLRGAYEWTRSIVVSQKTEEGKDLYYVEYPNVDRTEKIPSRGLLVYTLLTFMSAEPFLKKGELDIDLITKIIDTLMYSYTNEKEETFLQTSNAHIINIASVDPIMYEDRTLLYCLLEGLSWANKTLSDNRGKVVTDEEFLKKMSYVIDSTLRDIMIRQHPENHLWNEESFKIYYTQRSLEALTYYAVYVSDELKSKLNLIPLSMETNLRAAVQEAVRKVTEQISNMLITEILSNTGKLMNPVSEKEDVVKLKTER